MESDLKLCWQIPQEKNLTNDKELTDFWGKSFLIRILKHAN